MEILNLNHNRNRSPRRAETFRLQFMNPLPLPKNPASIAPNAWAIDFSH